MPTLGVVGVATGFTLKENAMIEIHEVMDHLYPGIMTIGIAMMAESAKEEVLAQIPELRELPQCTAENYQEVAQIALEKFGPTVLLFGGHTA